jgi:integrase
MGSHPIGLEAAASTHPPASLSTQTVTVYTRHQESCPKNGEPYWKRCHCMKYLYVYRENTSRQVSAKTRSWEKAEERAQEIRDSWSPVKALQRELEEKVRRSEAREVLITDAVALFLKEVERLNREEATRAKYRLTLENRLLNWCAQQKPTVARLSELDVETMRRWIHSWPGAPTTRHNQHQRVITFFFFCVEQGWMKENPARKIKKVAPEQDETQPFTREQYEALIDATWIYDSRDGRKNGDTVNARRARTYLKLLRWSGLRAGDAACLSRDKLRDDDSLFLYQKKVKGKGSSAVYGLLPHDVAEELRHVPPNAYTHPSYFFWSARSNSPETEQDDPPVRCQLTDLSLGGCYLDISSPFPVSTRVTLSMRAGSAEMRAEGVVRVMHPEKGMGVEFSQTTPEHRQAVEKFLSVLTQNRDVLPELTVEPEGLESDVEPSQKASSEMAESEDPLLSLFRKQGTVPSDSFHEELKKQRGLAATAGSA